MHHLGRCFVLWENLLRGDGYARNVPFCADFRFVLRVTQDMRFAHMRTPQLHFGTVACDCPRTSRRSFAKRKSKAWTLLQYNFPLPFSRTKSMRSIALNPQLVAVWNLALASMESMRSIVWNQERREKEIHGKPWYHTPYGQFHTIRCANWCHTKSFGLG